MYTFLFLCHWNEIDNLPLLSCIVLSSILRAQTLSELLQQRRESLRRQYRSADGRTRTQQKNQQPFIRNAIGGAYTKEHLD